MGNMWEQDEVRERGGEVHGLYAWSGAVHRWRHLDPGFIVLGFLPANWMFRTSVSAEILLRAAWAAKQGRQRGGRNRCRQHKFVLPTGRLVAHRLHMRQALATPAPAWSIWLM